tara:strand:- start:134 stop:343 length:210 start_codon:yes stop_codon:yes gene_type:complete
MTNKEFIEMYTTRASVLAEINHVLEDNVMTKDELLDELLLVMTMDELKENWEYIKRVWEIGVPDDAGSA